MKASVIIVTHNSAAFIGPCLRSLVCQTVSVELVVVDNGSTDGTADLVRSHFPEVKVVTQPNLGFGAGCNRGAKEATGDVLAFLNPDTKADDKWFATLVSDLIPGRIHTSQLLDDKSGRVQTLGLDLHYTGVSTLRRSGSFPIYGPPEEVPGLSGAAFAVMRSDFVRLGGFDEGFFLYMEDVDLSWRARRAGIKIFGIPQSRVVHRRAGSITKPKLEHIRRGRARLLKKHVPQAVRRRLAPAFACIALAERLAGPPSPVDGRPLVPDPMESRPAWLRTTLPLRPFAGFAKLGVAILNPVLGIAALAWKREPTS